MLVSLNDGANVAASAIFDTGRLSSVRPVEWCPTRGSAIDERSCGLRMTSRARRSMRSTSRSAICLDEASMHPLGYAVGRDVVRSAEGVS